MFVNCLFWGISHSYNCTIFTAQVPFLIAQPGKLQGLPRSAVPGRGRLSRARAIAGAGCGRPSRARVAAVHRGRGLLHCGRGLRMLALHQATWPVRLSALAFAWWILCNGCNHLGRSGFGAVFCAVARTKKTRCKARDASIAGAPCSFPSSAVPGRGRLLRAWAAPIAGAGCSRPSRARAAPLQSRFTAVPSIAEPGNAATRACCSNTSTGRAGGRTRHGLFPPLEVPWCMICMGGTARPAFLRMMIVRAAIAVRACCTRAEASEHYGVLCFEQCCARACNHACVPAVICATRALGGSSNPLDSTFGAPCQAWNQNVPPVSVNLLQLPSFGSEFYLACFLSLSLAL